MNKESKFNYFLFFKLCYLLFVFWECIYGNYSMDILKLGITVILMGFLITSLILMEFEKYRLLLSIIYVAISLVLIVFFHINFSLLLFIPLLDLTAHFKAAPYLYFGNFILVLFNLFDVRSFIISTLFIDAIYVQYHVVLAPVLDSLHNTTATEARLKGTIYRQNVDYSRTQQKNKLKYENLILQERNQMSQNLHDKLGHSINGSIYQLEATKLLIGKDPEAATEILQKVIDTLRTSFDEIRSILRKKKPETGEIFYLKLWNLCEKINDDFHINAEFTCLGNKNAVPDYIWQTIFYNCQEACSNAMKHSHCKNIAISMNILNKVVRCNIKNDGHGCSSIVKGMGLKGMEERVQDVNGTITFECQYGFTINMILPLSK